MRINLGAGDRYADGWINVDHRESPHRRDVTFDLSGPALPWPWPYGSITHVYAGHVLEHLSIENCHYLLSVLLPHMAPHGEIMVVGPDIPLAEAMIADGTFDFRWGHTLESLKYGGHRWPGDAHLWECSGPLVADMLEECGWGFVADVGIANVPPFWPVADRAPQWQCAVFATVERPS